MVAINKTLEEYEKSTIIWVVADLEDVLLFILFCGGNTDCIDTKRFSNCLKFPLHTTVVPGKGAQAQICGQFNMLHSFSR